MIMTFVKKTKIKSRAFITNLALKDLSPETAIAIAAPIIFDAGWYRKVFDAGWYRKVYSEYLNQGDDEWNHYLNDGGFHGLDPSPFFDSDWYLEENPDVKNAGINPFLHFITIGYSENRNPSPFFDIDFYTSSDPEIRKQNINPLVHYLKHGYLEGRLPHPIYKLKTIFTGGYSSPLPTPAQFACRDDVPQKKIAVMIPCHNKWAYTKRCIDAILNSGDMDLCDIWVIDDASIDETSLIESNSKFKVLRISENLGFVEACNFGFLNLCEKYEMIYLLNNDTEPLQNFLSEALVGINREDNISMCGSRLINSDGTLQEAGGIIFQEGSCANYGFSDNPDLALYNKFRHCDYVSGAALLIRSNFLVEAGFFDSQFSPGYYEDTDLSMRARSLGWSVVVNPKSAVIHHLGKSHGTDVGNLSSIKQYQQVNLHKFVSKWRNELSEHLNQAEDSKAFEHYSHFLHVSAHRITKDRRKLILWVDHNVPQPLEDSGSLRAMSLIEETVALGYDLIFLSKNDYLVGSLGHRKLIECGIPVFRNLVEVKAFLQACQLDVELLWVSRITSFIEGDDALIENFLDTKIIFDSVDLHFQRLELEKELEVFRYVDVKPATPSTNLEIEKIRRSEIAAAKLADLSIAVSVEEQETLASFVPGAVVEVLRNVNHIPNKIKDFDARTGIVFIGGFAHEPNLDGILWFLNDIWPLVDDAVRSQGLKIIGSQTPKILKELKAENVEILGYVPDSNSIVSNSRLSIAPLRYGAGMKGKVTQAISLGTPVVGTTYAFQGLNEDTEVKWWEENDPSQFAKKINHVYANQELWQSMQELGRSYSSSYLSRLRARQDLIRIFELLE
jgi:GT2 family glycosyltransferase